MELYSSGMERDAWTWQHSGINCLYPASLVSPNWNIATICNFYEIARSYILLELRTYGLLWNYNEPSGINCSSCDTHINVVLWTYATLIHTRDTIYYKVYLSSIDVSICRYGDLGRWLKDWQGINTHTTDTVNYYSAWFIATL